MFFRENDSCAASVVFISCDFVGQKHLCYLISSQSQLFCAKLDKTNESRPEVILGSTTIIPAKDASSLPVSCVYVFLFFNIFSGYNIN